MRKFLAHTSAGRLMAASLFPEECHPLAKQKEWRQSVGDKCVDVSSGYPKPSDNQPSNNQPSDNQPDENQPPSSGHNNTNNRDGDEESTVSQNISHLSVPTQSGAPPLEMTRFDNTSIARLEDDPAELSQGGGTATPPGRSQDSMTGFSNKPQGINLIRANTQPKTSVAG
jgi:hypothetical protein